MKLRLNFLWLICLVSVPCWAVSGGKRVAFEEQLEYVLIEVNGTPRRVDGGAELVVVKGDRIKITKVGLMDPKRSVGSVNLVGYRHPKALRRGEDRGYLVRTDVDLIKSWSVGRRGDLYRVRALSRGLQNGEVFVRLIAPQLKYAQLEINGHVRMVREGELLRVKASDELSVSEVATNIANDTKKVDFQIVPTNRDLELVGVKLYELRFLRGKQVFARIPMQVEGHEHQ